MLLVACADDEQQTTPTADAGDTGQGTDTGPLDVGATDVAAMDAAAELDGSAADADAVDAVVEPPTYRSCMDPFVTIPGFGPDYDQYEPIIGSHCQGTNHQDIAGVERVVFFGDSVTVGTPPTQRTEYYRTILGERLIEEYGEIQIDNFARFGARTDDLLQPSDEQLKRAFPDVEERTTLVIMTVGGNDLFKWVEMNTDGEPLSAINAKVDEAIGYMREAIEWLRDPERFPNGVFIVFANTYEYTDGTGDVQSCNAAVSLGIGETWDEAPETLIRFNEAFMQIAVETGSDVVFMQEGFCGHGFRAGAPEAACDRGHTGEPWFDPTCIHPTPEGHAALADMFWAVITE